MTEKSPGGAAEEDMDLEQALEQPAGNDHSADTPEMETEPASAPDSALPIQTLTPAPEETDAENEMATDDVAGLNEIVTGHIEEPGEGETTENASAAAPSSTDDTVKAAT